MLGELTEREIDDNGVYQIGPTPFLSHHHYIEQNDRSTNEG